MEKAEKSFLGEVFGWDSGYKDGISLHGLSVYRVDEMLLSGKDESPHLGFDIIEYPT